jgi:uncharacterized membrane protein YqaE (UPF0057 family)
MPGSAVSPAHTDWKKNRILESLGVTAMDHSLFLLFTLAVLYFLPTVVAMFRGIKTPQGPILLNILLGWTILGWIAALIWAACAPIAPSASRTPHDRGAMFQLGRAVGAVRNTFRPTR